MEDMNQKRFKNMYETLLHRIKEKEPAFSDYRDLLTFCNLCRSYNVDDFNQFRQNYGKYSNLSKAVTEQYLKQYSHVPESERMDYIAKMIRNNIIENGFVYHLANINDYESFRANGISPGAGTREMASILSRLPKEKRKLITPFTSGYIDENGNPLKRFFYSSELDFSRNYGEKPEWLRELGYNIEDEQYWREQTKGLDSSLVQELENLYENYNKKYEKENGKLLIMLPLRKVMSEEELEASESYSAEQLIEFITRMSDDKCAETFVSRNEDGSYTETSHIDSSELIFFDATKKTIELGTEMRKRSGDLTLQEIGQKTGRDVLRNQSQAQQVSTKLGKDMTMPGEEDKRKI